MGYTYFSFETEGPTYTDLYKSNADRVKEQTAGSGGVWWWLRSANYGGSDYFCGVGSGGYDGYGYSADYQEAVALGFCM